MGLVMDIFSSQKENNKSIFDLLKELDDSIHDQIRFLRMIKRDQKKCLSYYEKSLWIYVWVNLGIMFRVWWRNGISTDGQWYRVIFLFGWPLFTFILWKCVEGFYNLRIKENEKELITLKKQRKRVCSAIKAR